MRLRVYKGRKLDMIAELALEQIGPSDHVVMDCESGKPLTLAELLRSFRDDDADPEIGWVRITVEVYERGARRHNVKHRRLA